MCTRSSLRLVAPPRCGPVGAPVERFRRVGVGGAGKAGQGNHGRMTTQTTFQDPVTCSAFWVCSSGRGVGSEKLGASATLCCFHPALRPLPMLLIPVFASTPYIPASCKWALDPGLIFAGLQRRRRKCTARYLVSSPNRSLSWL